MWKAPRPIVREGGWGFLFVGVAPSGRSENKTARNLATAKLIQCFVRFDKRTRGHLAAHVAVGSHGENLPHVLSGADSGGLDSDFPCRHQDGGKADRVSR